MHDETSAASNRFPLPPLAILGGVRTPFVKAFGEARHVSAVELGATALAGALHCTGVSPCHVDEVILGSVSGQADAANVARVIAWKAGIPYDSIAHTVNRNCGSGMESVIDAWHSIATNRSRVIVAGGVESMSNVPMIFGRSAVDKFSQLSKARSVLQRVRAMAAFRLRDFQPVAGLKLGLVDPTCGLNMGETAELLADEFRISREVQDNFALRSHQRAACAWKRGFFRDEVTSLKTESGEIQSDLTFRADTSATKLASLRTVFKPTGSITAGNSCSITDGAVTIVCTASDKLDGDARPLGFVTAYAISGCDPRRMGLGPAFAIDQLLKSTGMSLRDFDLYEINEAFAAQVLACVKALNCPSFCREQLGRERVIGTIPLDRLNVNGGAIALGHPVGASGARLILTLLRSLRELGLKRGLAALCIGGGQGIAMSVEAVPANLERSEPLS